MPTLTDTKNVLTWASTIEPEALEQAENTAGLPFVAKPLALMPDAHYGRGSTVGSVIATQGAIIPAAVGVDIGCADADSEYLSPTGWRRIADYDNGLVMQYDPDTGEGEFVMPSRYVVRPQEYFLHFHTKYGIDQMLTDDHRMLVYRIVGRDRRRERVVYHAGDLAYYHSKLVQGAKVEFETTFALKKESEVDLTDDEIRLQIAVSADAHLDKGRAVVRLKKERKRTRLIHLLVATETAWTQTTTDGVTRISFKPPVADKSLDLFWKASPAQLAVISEECLLWDGNEKGHCFYTRVEEHADFIQYAFTATGHRAVKRGDAHPDGKVDYRVFRYDKTRVGLAGAPKSSIERVASTDGKAYCFTVPSGFWVMRRGGNVVMTGNCGMIAVETGLTSRDLPDNLDDLHHRISRSVPAGVGKGHDDYAVDVFALLGAPGTELTTHQQMTVERQYGTLGSGNHFVEVCLDERDRVWVVLHSGSRGIGNQLAMHHIKVAKGLMKEYFISLPDPDLAYLVQGTQPFGDYIYDLRWAQEYAYHNREQMMGAVLKDFCQVLGRDIAEVERINTHHNYTAQENHRGRRYWITRKGAISARKGQLGIIPGSMGTGTYIVRGLGNPASWESCAHGAGRRMSRSAAKKALTVDSLREVMEDRVWNTGQAEKLVDEHPSAYKSIEEVMRAQADLVEPVHTLRQILNYKGA